MPERENVQGQCPFPGACTGVVNRSRRRSTSCITLTTVERVVDECTNFYRAMLSIRSTSHGPVSVRPSVTSRCSIETVERIEPVFGMWASFKPSYTVLKGNSSSAVSARFCRTGQLATADTWFRTCRRHSFCTVAWQLARFQLTWRIARSLGDSWASCITHWSRWRKKLCGFNKKWLPWQRPLSDRNRISQQSSVPIRLPIRIISRKSVA